MGVSNRRTFLRTGLFSGAWLAAAGCSGGQTGADRSSSAGPELSRTVPFLDEEDVPLEQAFGHGLDGRLFTDLSGLSAESLAIPTERFFVRTRRPDLLDDSAPWTLRARGLVKEPREIPLSTLEPLVQPAGFHVMECSGNTSGGHFGLLSAASWSGVPLTGVLDMLQPLRGASRVLISGFDEHSAPSRHRSVAGASWIFTPEQLRDANAFLATAMNDAPLTSDHGAPVRLVVPGWYGCVNVKWVDRIEWVDDNAPATPQMREFAERTHQSGIPHLARDYRPAALEQAAMAVRVERPSAGTGGAYRVTGVTWGGKLETERLMIRFRPDEAYLPVRVAPPSAGATGWALWTCDWRPAASGVYALQLRFQDPNIAQRRLDTGHYTRYVQL